MMVASQERSEYPDKKAKKNDRFLLLCHVYVLFLVYLRLENPMVLQWPKVHSFLCEEPHRDSTSLNTNSYGEAVCAESI
jgi:hypothetical protein